MYRASRHKLQFPKGKNECIARPIVAAMRKLPAVSFAASTVLSLAASTAPASAQVVPASAPPSAVKGASYPDDPRLDVALRMLKRSMLAIGMEGHTDVQISLSKLERLLKNLRMAIRDQRPFRQSLAWTVIPHGGGFIEVRTAPPRRAHKEKQRAGNLR